MGIMGGGVEEEEWKEGGEDGEGGRRGGMRWRKI